MRSFTVAPDDLDTTLKRLFREGAERLVRSELQDDGTYTLTVEGCEPRLEIR